MYSIKVSYKTGDSFKTYDTENILNYDWENIETVKSNMRRIKQHYDWIKEKYYDKLPKPNFMKELTKESQQYAEGCIPLKKDDGSIFQLSTPWTGYFERLKSIEVVVNNYKIEC